MLQPCACWVGEGRKSSYSQTWTLLVSDLPQFDVHAGTPLHEKQTNKEQKPVPSQNNTAKQSDDKVLESAKMASVRPTTDSPSQSHSTCWRRHIKKTTVISIIYFTPDKPTSFSVRSSAICQRLCSLFVPFRLVCTVWLVGHRMEIVWLCI